MKFNIKEWQENYLTEKISKGKTYTITKEIEVSDEDGDDVYLTPRDVIKITDISGDGFVEFDLIKSDKWGTNKSPITGFGVWDFNLKRKIK